MKRNREIVKIIKTLIIALIAVAFILPFAWMVTSSLKQTREVFSPNWRWLPETFQWQNYVAVWTDPEVSMLRAFGNTAFITIVSTVVQLTVASLAAYAFAKIRFKGKGIVFGMFLCTMMMPTEVTIVPRFMLFKTVGLYNNLWSIILPHFFNATSIFMLRQFFSGIPDELEESAAVDGAGVLRTFLTIVLPNAVPMMITVFMFAFSWQWTDNFYTDLFYTTSGPTLMPDIVTVPLSLVTSSAASNMVTTAVYNTCGILILAPLLIMYIFLQKYIIQGIERSGIVG